MMEGDERGTKAPEHPDKNQDRIDQDLEIMEKHAQELDLAEEDIKESMKKRDREYKDARLHSIPKAKKHSRA